MKISAICTLIVLGTVAIATADPTPTQPEQKVKLSVCTARRIDFLQYVIKQDQAKLRDYVSRQISKDKNLISADRAKLRALAGRNGVQKQRVALLQQIISCRRETIYYKRGGMPKSGGLVKQIASYQSEIKYYRHGGILKFGDLINIAGNGIRFPGEIGYLKCTITAFQILKPHKALCQTTLPGLRDSDTGEYLIYPQDGPIVMVEGYDFNNVAVGDDVSNHLLWQVKKTVTYSTVSGGTNTIWEIHPVKIVNDINPKRKRARQASHTPRN
ncbi:MAG: hypothetical protein ACYCUV_14685 [Phycisphaerae bacterium]